jgi:hypothetical protein
MPCKPPTANSGQIFENGTAVFYLVTPNLIVIMGADAVTVQDAIGFIQFRRAS